MNTLFPFQMFVTACPVAQHHVPESLYLIAWYGWTSCMQLGPSSDTSDNVHTVKWVVVGCPFCVLSCHSLYFSCLLISYPTEFHGVELKCAEVSEISVLEHVHKHTSTGSNAFNFFRLLAHWIVRVS